MAGDKGLVIAIDGPAGSGKSTVAGLVAEKLGYLYVDSGAMYRALTLQAIEEGIDFEDARALIELAHHTKIGLATDGHRRPKVLLNGKDVTSKIRDPEVTKKVVYLARVGGVRECMVALQREIRLGRNVVVEGRDIGTVVFPRADKKFYLDAHFKERVRRRFEELKTAGRSVSKSRVEGELLERDESDRTRKVGPLKKAKDAVYIDTTNLSIEEVARRVSSHLEAR